jgi:hypothetical protein
MSQLKFGHESLKYFESLWKFYAKITRQDKNRVAIPGILIL